MHRYYTDVNAIYGEGIPVTSEQDEILDLIESEQANGVITSNVIENDNAPEEDTEDKEIGDRLRFISEDLDNRWKGAVYALNPQNPDAARHFCISAREIFTEFIEMKAPDSDVFRYNPGCAKTDRGNATRKEKIRYMMRNKHMDSCVVEFIEADVTNILELLQVKKRVEQGINFLCAISE